MATAKMIAQMLARKEKLTFQEEQQLTDYLAINETVRAWVKTGASYPSLDFLEADSAYFEFMPLEFGIFTLNGTQTIPDNTGTFVQFDSAGLYESRFAWDSADPEKISVSGQLPGRAMAVMGTAQFDPNSAGWRGVYFIAYDSDDVQLSGKTMIQLPAPSGENAGLVFSYPYIYSSETAYFKCSVQQTSGGNLDLNWLSAGLYRIL